MQQVVIVDNQQQQQQQQQYSVDQTGASEQQHEQAANYEQQQQTSQSAGSTSPSDNYDQSTSAYHGSVGGARLNHNLAPSQFARQQQSQQTIEDKPSVASTPSDQHTATSPYGYAKLDRERQQNHLEQQQAQHQAQLAELMSNQQQQQQQQESDQRQQQYQTTVTPLTLTTMAAAIEQQQQQQAEQEQEQIQQQQQQGYESNPTTTNGQTSQESSQALLINPDTPIQMPILDQQSLIGEHEADALGSDDGAKQRQSSQPSAVYQVYQAYYAPKDHKPLPGYVRLSLEEFNELFKDAEIQFVDKNLNGIARDLVNQQQQQHQVAANEASDRYDNSRQSNQHQLIDHMKASASEQQAIVVDRRSISDRRSSVLAERPVNTTNTNSSSESVDKRLKQLGQAAVKKIISIRNSRQAATKQILQATSAKTAKKISMKRIKAPLQLKASKLDTSIAKKSTTSSATSRFNLLSTTEMPAQTKKATTKKTSTITTVPIGTSMPKSKSAKKTMIGDKRASVKV